MHITVFFTYGVSLQTWAKTGLLQREIQLYLELKRNYDVQIQFLTYGDISDRIWEEKLDGIKLLPIYERMSRPSFKYLAVLKVLLVPWYFSHELKLTDLFKTNQIWGGLVAVLAKWLHGKPLLVRCGYEFYDFTRKQKRSRLLQLLAFCYSKIVYSQANMINVATISDQRLIVKEFGIDKSRIELRPNWIDTEKFKPLSMNKENRILFVGRFIKQKNLSLLLDSLRGTGFILDLIGDGELCDNLCKMAKDNKVEIHLLGQKPNDQMPEIYNHYQLYVLCSQYEGNPKSLLEAMACGCAVVGTDVTGIREEIRHEKTGLIVGEDAESLRTAIQRLMNDQSFCHELGKQARKYILENNSLQSAIAKEYSVYKQLVQL